MVIRSLRRTVMGNCFSIAVSAARFTGHLLMNNRISVAFGKCMISLCFFCPPSFQSPLEKFFRGLSGFVIGCCFCVPTFWCSQYIYRRCINGETNRRQLRESDPERADSPLQDSDNIKGSKRIHDDDEATSSDDDRLSQSQKKQKQNRKLPARDEKNYQFYSNKLSSEPNGDFIDVIHEKWFGDYYKLESHHGFIQWLFPLPEPGVNWQAQTLKPHEIQLMKEDEAIRRRILDSYRLMLDFYGMELVSDETGEVKRSDNWQYRFNNLKRNSHNNLRISRILRSLGLLGFEHLQTQWLRFLVHEIFVEMTLTACKHSCLDYWIKTVDSVEERDELYGLAEPARALEI